jgi:hypothetical protein
MNIKWNQLRKNLGEYFSNSNGVHYIIAPFISPRILESLVKENSSDGIVVTSWRSDHLRSGVSSLDIFPILEKYGWKLFVNDRLHMKFYSCNLDSAWIGSANVTGRALDDDESSNHELLCFINTLESETRIHIKQLQNDSQLVTPRVFSEYKTWFDQQSIIQPLEPQEIFKPFNLELLLTSDLPLTIKPSRVWEIAQEASSESLETWEQHAYEHDRIVYPADLGNSQEEYFANLRPVFFEKPFIKKFSEVVTPDGIQFGSIRRWLEENCHDIPQPHRREITKLVQGLINWFVDLDPETFEVYVPGNYSERLRRKI